MAVITIGANDYDSLSSVADADTYLAGDIARSTAWALRNNDLKGRALISATRMMLALPWCAAAPPDPTAAQLSPIPEVAAMLAADLAAKPKLFADASSNSNIKLAKAGSAQVEFFSPVDGGPPLPLALWNLLFNAGLVCLGASAGSSVTDGPIITGICDGARPYEGRPPWDWPFAAGDYD